MRSIASQPMRSIASQSGFTLIELMIAVAILAIIAAVGLPIYRGYVETGRAGALQGSMATMEMLQEDLRLRTGAYGAGTWDPGGGDTSLRDGAVGWAPQGDDGATYVVVVSNGGASYDVTATDSSGYSICTRFPERTPCP